MELTTEQMEQLQKVLQHLRKGHHTLAHISGAAGSGKTLLALCCAYALCEEHLEMMQRQSTDIAVKESRKFRVLLLSSSRPTSLFIIKWFHKLCPDLPTHVDFYGRDRLDEFASCYRMYLPEENAHKLELEIEHDVCEDFDLVIGEEYHHCAHILNINRHLNMSSHVVLLSDGGQCAEKTDWKKIEAAINHKIEHFLLHQIARSSSKIVGASSTFRFDASMGLLREVVQESTGSCKSQFFELAQSGVSDRDQKYAAQVAIALEAMFGGNVDYADHQIAIIVRDVPFRDGLLKALVEHLSPEAEDVLQLKVGEVTVPLRFVRAEEAAATLSASNTGLFGVKNLDTEVEAPLHIVLDCVDNIDGQEFPAAMLVGMDISKGKATPAEWKATPSCLYRGMTRAQFYLAIVNECIDDGFLSHIRNYTFNSEDDYDHANHIARMEGRLPTTPAELPEVVPSPFL